MTNADHLIERSEPTERMLGGARWWRVEKARRWRFAKILDV